MDQKIKNKQILISDYNPLFNKIFKNCSIYQPERDDRLVLGKINPWLVAGLYSIELAEDFLEKGKEIEYAKELLEDNSSTREELKKYGILTGRFFKMYQKN